MAKELLIYGIPKDETERYTESLLSSRCETRRDVETVLEAASKDGYHSFRITWFDGSAPDFAGVLARSING